MLLDSLRTPRTQRVSIAIPVRVSGNPTGNAPLDEVTETLLVNSRGALITLSVPVAKGQKLSLVNMRTHVEIACTVVNTRADIKTKGKTEVGVAFDQPMPRYWGLFFPPDDWNSGLRKIPEAPK
jgi:hypothetical protein